MASVSFIDTAFEVPNGTSCPICFGEEVNSETGYFVVHDGGDAHPIHKKCVKRWIKDNPTCPSCRIPINDRMITHLEALQNAAASAAEGASMGTKSVSNINVTATAVAMFATALILGGAWAARDALALSGGGYGMAGLAGIVGRFWGNGAGAQSRVHGLAPVAAIAGVLSSLPALFSRMTQDANLLYGLATYGFVSASGFTRTAKAGTIGAVAHFAKHAFFGLGSWDRLATTVLGGLGTFVNGFKSRWEFNVLPVLAGMRASFWAYDQFGALPSAVIGCVVSGVIKSISIQALGEERYRHIEGLHGR